MMKCEGERFREASHLGLDCTGLSTWPELSEDQKDLWRKRARAFDSPDDLSDGENLSELPLGEHAVMMNTIEEIVQLRVAYLAQCARPPGEALDAIGEILGLPPATRTPKGIVEEVRAVTQAATEAREARVQQRLNAIPPLNAEPLESLVRRQGDLLQELARIAGLGDDSKGNEETARALIAKVQELRKQADSGRE